MGSPSDWIGYWNDAPPIYSGPQHRTVHYRAIADDIARHIPARTAHVMDFGCGDALSADRVAERCRRLILVDGAETVLAGLKERMSGFAHVAVVAPEAIEVVVPQGSLDLIVVNSVVQYLTADDLVALMRRLAPLLAAGGAVVVADVVPPDASPVHDAAALMAFAARNGFLLPAGVGLVRTFASNYRQLREKLGFSQYSESAFLTLMSRAGFECRRIQPNFGHNQRRMAFRATVAPVSGTG
ncbi:MAG: class I SAM-dependent methyltransferase [Hyphomicrobiaceae bacterium]|nr:class I SAM-dependent methyltransferase [Hyphomicrobiaceae bacterium]